MTIHDRRLLDLSDGLEQLTQHHLALLRYLRAVPNWSGVKGAEAQLLSRDYDFFAELDFTLAGLGGAPHPGQPTG